MNSLFAAIRARATLIIAVVALTAAFGAGFALQGLIKDGEIASIQLEHQTEVAEAYAARNVALERARATEKKAGEDLAALSEKYVEDRQHENAVTQRRIADLAAGNERLRVDLEFATSSAGVRDPATAAGGGDGQATATLERRAAARLEQRYADYNELVDQIGLCQATVQTYLDTVNGKP